MVVLAGGCLAVGCAKNETADVAQLRDAVGQLREEVAQLRKDVRELKMRGERRAPFAARPSDGARAREMSATARSESAAPIARSHGARVHKQHGDMGGANPTIEELKARHEAMRDPAQREKMRAEHRARMEERRQRMEERRRQYLERHVGEASPASRKPVSTSDSK